MSTIADEFSALTAEQKRRLLKQLLQEKAARRRKVHPVSHMQRDQWVQNQLAPESGAYGLPIAARIRSRVDIAALHQAFQALVDRHEVLRTTYESHDGVCVQVIHRQAKAAFEHYDASQWPESALTQRLHEELNRAFDLQNGPVHRVVVFSRSPEDHILLLVVHHIACDFWSIEILIEELRALYRSIKTNTPPVLKPLDRQFTDYVDWEQELLASPEADELFEFWKKQLAPPVPILELPTDQPHPTIKSYRGGTRLLKLDNDLADALRMYSKSENVTLYATLLTAFQTLLYRYSGQDDIIVGAPTAGRSQPEFRDVVGCLVGGIFIRADFAGSPTFTELLHQVRRKLLEALEHQDYPNTLIIEKLKLPIDPSRSPIAQALFGWDRTIRLEGHPDEASSEDWLNFEGLLEDTFSLQHRGSLFDLMMIGVDSGTSLSLIIQHCTDIFNDETILRLEGHFQNLLEAITRDPNRSIAELPMLSDGERRTLLNEWSIDAPVHKEQACFHELFERAVARYPERTAVVFEGEELSFRELDARANQIGNWLSRQQVSPETKVALCLEPSIELIAALFGVLKAGDAYVPLDPKAPADRLEYVLADADIEVVLTQGRLHDQFKDSSCQTLVLDAEGALEDESTDRPAPTAAPGDAAYVIYTSGSTGEPKGVVIEHHSVVSLSHALRDTLYPPDECPMRVGLYAPVVFDASVEQIMQLVYGNTLYIPSQDVRLNPQALRAFVEENAIDVLDITPTQWKLLKEAGLDPRSDACPRRIFLGGEPVDQSTWDELASIERLHAYNVYGPTESTVDGTLCRISREQPKPVIGRPIPGTEAYILDEHQQPVPVGVVGELCLAGAGLARGYLKRPELTAEKFVKHPFSDDPDARIYKTGDLVRFRPNRCIEYVGRRDGQVKIRGFRIEIQEIEAAIARHPDVGSCAVAATNGAGEPKLVAYVVPNAGTEIRPGSLRSFVTGKLPYYMVPSNFIHVDRLPMNTSGKVDLKALPSADGIRPEAAADYVAPRNEIEQQLAGIWGDVLDIGEVGVHDSFFDLGGHSILATRIISRVRSDMGIDIPIRAIFESPTIAEFGMRVEIAKRSNTAADAIALRPTERDGDLPLSFAQQRLWLIDQLMPGSTAYNIPFGVRIRGRLDVEVLRECFAEIYRRHESLRTTFKTIDGKPVQEIHSDLIPQLPLIDLQDLSPQEQAIRSRDLLRQEANRPFDLATDPKLRTTVLKLAEDQFVILLTMHHIASDAWSMGVLVRETAALYEAFARKQPTPLARLSIQYADYALWQRQSLTDEILAAEVDYWKDVLDGPLPQLELPTDRPRPAVQTDNGSLLVRMLPRSLADELERLSRREGVTLFMTLYCAYVTLLHRLTGQTDFTVGTPVAGRDRIETEGLIGFFVNTLVLRSDLSDDPTFQESLAQVKETCLGAYAHQQLPFEHLVDALKLKRDLSHSALFQTMFSLQNAPMPTVEMEGGLTFEPMDIPDRPAMFDLTLDVSQTDEGMLAAWEFNTDLFDRDTVERFANSYELLLRAIISETEARVSALPVLSEAQRQELLVDWNDGPQLPAAESSFTRLFEAQVQRTPDSPAVVFEDRQLTFSELNAQANKLAHLLEAQGVKPETTIGLCLEPSPELIVGLLAIQKAGGAYVPVEPFAPAERRAFIFEDAEVQAIVTQSSLRDAFAESGLPIVCVDEEHTFASHNADNLPTSPSPTDSAYVIYTSGSTGEPKGVVVEHHSVVSLSHALRDTLYPPDECPMRVGLYAPVVFDASVEQIMQLVYGNTLYIPSQDVRLNPQALRAFVEENAIDVLDITPTQWKLLKEAGLDPRSDACPRRIFLGGEPVDQSTWDELASIERLHAYNVYGPTESTVDGTLCRIGREQPKPVIGRPIPGTEAYILDEHQQPVPVGVVGELCLAGAGLARGYLKRPELTAEKFIKHPFNDDPNARLYKTGDRARYLADGWIEFLDRADDEVKIRGFRITLGEIEVALGRHPAVRKAVVVAREDAQGAKRLVAYVVPEGDEEPTFAELRQFLAGSLPEYMLPGVFVTLDALPLTTNGKLDKQALPEPDVDRLDVGTEFVAPSTPIEEQVAAIWSEILGVQRVGIHDNFFELGGYSLLVVQIISRMREAFGIEIPFRSLFEAPTVAELALRVEIAQQSDQGLEAPPLRRVEHTGPMPLSFAQQRLWFLDGLTPDSAAYNMAGAIRIRGPLELDALRQSLEEVFRRHDALRTNFTTIDGEPMQVVSSEPMQPPVIVDLTDRPEDDREEEMLRLILADAERPFDLSRDQLLRVLVIKLGAQDHALMLNMHHIISDGWSTDVLIREVVVLYQGYSEDRPISLPELPVQYTDYAHWQRNWLQGEALEQQLAFWKEQLAGSLPDLELPADRPRPPVQSQRGAHLELRLSPELSEQLKALGRREGVTPFMVLLAAYYTLLHRHTNQTDLLVGTPVAGRDRVETEGLIGVLINMLVLRGDLSANPSFLELLSQVRETCLAAYAHQNLPFEELVEALQIERSLSRSPVFQTMFVYQENPVRLPTPPNGWQIEMIEPDIQAEIYDISLSIEDTPDGLRGICGYSTDLFDESTIQRLLEHFELLLEGVVADPEMRLSELPVLGESERQQLLFEWNATESDFPRDASLPELFREQVERTPEGVAVVFEGQELTYRELDARSNQVARFLRNEGIGPDILVGICINRSPEMLIGVLGILKAGGAYVPLDPDYPSQRLEMMLEDAAPPIVLSETALVDRVPQSDARVVLVDCDQELLSQPDDALEFTAGPSDLAYIIFTSGSTGRPKGVQIEHACLGNFLQSMQHTPGLTADDVLVAVTTLSFDIATLELYLPLIVGARVVIASRDIAIDGGRLLDLLESSSASVLQATPATWRLLLAAGTLPAGLKVMCGGEPFPPDLADTLCEAGHEVWNMYGPTETTVWSTVCRLRAGERPISIGRPIDNTRIYILDSSLQPTPLGVSGELFIGGDGVARGYFGRPDLTEERFLDDPFASEPGARMYKTGDLVRWLADGRLEHLGRMDHQVKIRGFRIELQEIEAALAAHPAVQQAAVLAREDAPGAKRLVGYVVSAQEDAPAFSELRRFVSERLPDYMLPSAIVVLDEFPRLPNGKINRSDLPAPDGDRPELESEYVAPTTPVQQQLASIWSQVLHVERIGIHDNFFELGGYSLIIVQILARLREQLNVDLPFRSLFEAPTIAELSLQVEAGGSIGPQAPPLVAIQRSGPQPASYSQERMWLQQQIFADNSGFNMPGAVRIRGTFDAQVFERSLQEVVQRHESLRTRFEAVDGKPMQVVADEITLKVPVIDLSDLPESAREAEMQKRFEVAVKQPFDLANDQLIRAFVMRMDERDHVLFLNTHHIISDGWSTSVLIQEVLTLYRGYVDGKPAPLPELPIQYADFANWQRNWLTGEVLEEKLSYWKEKLAAPLPYLELPTDRPRPAIESGVGSHRMLRLSKELSEQTRAVARSEGVTSFMLHLATYVTLLHRHSQQTEIVIGTPVAGRDRMETEGLIGCFINMLAIRIDLSGNPTFQELLGRVRDVCLEAQVHQDAPFEQVVDALDLERTLSRAPVFQTMFAYQEFPFDISGGASDWDVDILEPDIRSETHDVSLNVENNPDGLLFALSYSTDLFDGSTIERMLEHFHLLFEAIVADPGRRLSDLPMLGEAERRHILDGWNEGGELPAADSSFPRLFEEQVERTPDAPAVVSEETRLSYGELNAKANQLSRFLKRRGVGPDSMVAICLERSVDSVIAVLAILKAGGAYVPLDPHAPAQRRAFMLQDCGAKLLVTHTALRDAAANVDGLSLVCLDDAQQLDAEGMENLPEAPAPDQAAYVIYTSGSTGEPKGVVVEHRSVVSLSRALREPLYPAGDRPMRAALYAPLFFDASVEQLIQLVYGNTLYICSESVRLNPDELVAFIRKHSIDVLDITPTHLQLLLGAGLDLTADDAPETVCIGGEAVSQELWRQLSGIDRLRAFNVYGPTESTVDATLCRITPDQATPVIGRPIRGTETYILDSHNQPTALGVVGELCLAGAGLARGYLNRPELTAEKFIQHPFSEDAHARLYKTGDLARYLPDGSIEYLGRIDDEVKIRGFRITLGEIEFSLTKHPAIREAVVLAREDQPGIKRLVAYLVAESNVPDFAELRQYLGQLLPDYMLPAAFVTLEKLPLTPNGKLDKDALPTPQIDRLEIETEFAPPSTPLEEQIADIWGEVLGVDRVGIHDNFFDLGGYSLLIVKIVTRLTDAFGVELPMRILFEAPTIAELAIRVDAARQSSPSSQAPPLVPVKRTGELSFAQQRMYFVNQMNPDVPTFNMAGAVRIRGPLELGRLERSLREVVQRHETLRTTFKLTNGRPLLMIAERASIELPVVDLSHLPEAERETEMRRLVDEDGQNPFDLHRDPLLRVFVIRMGQDDHVLAKTMHHIISDGWSENVLLRELLLLYQASGTPFALPPLPIQYGDYAAWQREWLQGEVLEEMRGWWKQHLAGPLPTLDLPTDRPRPAVRSGYGATTSTEIDLELTERLKALGRRESVTPFMLLLAAYSVVLHRYSGQSDIVIGTAVAGRNRVETENLIGLFANAMAIRQDLSGNPTFVELLARVREVCMGAFAHQDLPFDQVVESIEVDRNLSTSAVYQVMFTYTEKPPALTIDGGDWQIEALEAEMNTAVRDITLYAGDDDDGFQFSVRYSTDLFDAPTMDRLLQHLELVLRGMVDDPQRRISEVLLLGESEQQTVLVEWNKSEASAPPACVHDLFEQQVRLTPDAPALTFENAELTYQELDRRANQLAHHLQSLGVGPDVFVGICIDRSLEMFVALLGILKAGGAYVCLDSRLPESRLQLQLSDVCPPVVLTQQSLAPLLDSCGVRTLSLDTGWDEISKNVATAPARGAEPADAAYVIFTSGSTGRPKGVIVEHRQISHYALSAIDRLQIEPGMSYALVQPLFVDSSKTTIYPALLSGGCVHIFSETDSLNSRRLEEEFARAEIDCLKITPSHLAALHAMSSSPERLMPRKKLFLGGEASDRDWLLGLIELAPQCEIFNHYGPTETTVGVLTFPASRLLGETASSSVPIGRPLPGVQVYVLDEQMRPVPVGLPGELYIGGAAVARGYLNAPELTEQRFVPDPFGNTAGARLYRTGDRCRWLPGGNVEFLGRDDDQVKIRGFRIELREIENALAVHPRVEQAVVVAREDESSSQRLVAYVRLNATDDEAPPLSELRRFLGENLPDYMLPAAVVTVETFPLSPGGKINRKALPAPADDRPELEDAYVAPSTELEGQLAAIWSEVLHVERVGVHDNFFDLGGHSLLILQIVSRMSDVLGVELPFRAFFEAPTIAQFAPMVEVAQRSGTALQAPRLKPMESTGILSFSQRRSWFLDRLTPGTAAHNMIGAIRIRRPIDLDALERSCQGVVARHESLRTTFQVVDGRPVQVIADTGELPVPLIDLSDVSAEDREAEMLKRANAEVQRPFDLSRGPLLRLLVIRMEQDDHVLVASMHHIISDGWSVHVLVRDIITLYEAELSGDPATLTPLPVQYRDYAKWQREWLQGETLERLLDWWKQQLAAPLPDLELPTDYPRPAVVSDEGNTVAVEIGRELTGRIHAFCRREGVTPFMLLLAAYNVLLHRYSGQSDVVVGTPVAGRERVETEGLIGFFVNMLAIRSDLSGDPSFTEFLRRVREASLGAFAHQAAPLELVLDSLHIKRSLSRTPLFQTTFAYHNQPLRVQVADDEEQFEVVEVDTEKSIFDVVVHASGADDGLNFELRYRTCLFNADTIERLGRNFCLLLEGIVTDPDRPLSELPLLGEADERRMLVDWNDTAADFPRDVSYTQLFEAQVDRTPDDVAAVFEDETLTYRELDERSNQLAQELCRLGVGPEVLVGIYLNRSLDMLVAMLGTLKARGAYVPLDPAYPSQRLQMMLEDAAPAVVLSQSSLCDELPQHDAHVVLLDGDEELRSQPTGRLQQRPSPHDLAYVIFTSGSTGRPKGVQVEHGSLCNLLYSFQQFPGLSADDVCPTVTTLSFDIATLDLLLPLVVGARVVIIPADMARDGDRLMKLLDASGATQFVATPGTWRLLLANGSLPPGLRVFSGGEGLPPDLADALCAGGNEVWNIYGPTETTIWSTIGCVQQGDRPISIGRAIQNTRLYVLDKKLQPVPVGVAGELYIGGAGLARGYLKRPELTAERFLPDPFCDDPTARIYKTGDLVRWLDDGRLEHLGRIDFQVKIRGHRIELQEIEVALATHAAVGETLVKADVDESGTNRLVGYVALAKDAEAPSYSEFRQYLAKQLPEYMLPSAIVTLDAFPRLPSGKINRHELPAPSGDRPVLEEQYVAPSTPLQQQVAAIWSDVLKVDRVGIHDSFFELGGHSLMAAEMMLRVYGELQVEVPLQELFHTPTIAHYCQCIDDIRADQAPVCGDSPLVPIQTKGSKPPFFCIHSATGTALSFGQLSRRLGPEQPFYGLEARGLDGNAEPRTDIDSMVTAYLEAIRAVQPEGPYLLGGWSMGGLVAYEMAQRLAAEGQRVALLALFDSQFADETDSEADESDLRREVEDRLGISVEGWDLSLQELQQLSAEEQIAYVAAQFGLGERRPGENGSDRERELFLGALAPGLAQARGHLAVWNANVEAMRAYQPQASSLKAALFLADEAPRETQDKKVAQWKQFALGGVEICPVPGDHYSMFDLPHVENLAGQLSFLIDCATIDEPQAP